MVTIIQPKAEWLGPCPVNDTQRAMEMMEYATRGCYASRDKIKPGSAEPFLRKMLKSGHMTAFEPSNVILVINENRLDALLGVKYAPLRFCKWGREFSSDTAVLSCNLRVLMEHPEIIGLYAYGMGKEEVLNLWASGEFNYDGLVPFALERHVAHIVCDRAIMAEWTRHRVLSFLVQSTRYVDESDLRVIMPDWEDEEIFLRDMRVFECFYDSRRNYGGQRPEQARSVLPNCTATDMVVTGYPDGWDHFFDLRRGGGAHPQIIELAKELEKTKEW